MLPFGAIGCRLHFADLFLIKYAVSISISVSYDHITFTDCLCFPIAVLITI